MSASQNNLSLLLNQQDTNGTNILNRLVGAIAFAGVAGTYTDGILTGTGAVAQTLPTATILQYFLKNTHATGKIQVTWTPNGGASAVVQSVGPGGVLCFWMAASSSNGITALSYTADTAGTTYESFIGG